MSTTVAGPVPVYKIVEVDSRGRWNTLQFSWHGTRRLPPNKKLTASEFWGKLGSRRLYMRGFSCFLRLADAIDFYHRFEGSQYAIVRGIGVGVATHAEKQYQLAQQITLLAVMDAIPAALTEESPGESPGS